MHRTMRCDEMRCTLPPDSVRLTCGPHPGTKNVQVTKRVDTEEGQWAGWNWRTEGDMMVNGAFFVPSGEGLEAIYDKASSTDPKSSALVDQLTAGAGVLGGPRYVRHPPIPPTLHRHRLAGSPLSFCTVE